VPTRLPNLTSLVSALDSPHPSLRTTLTSRADLARLMAAVNEESITKYPYQLRRPPISLLSPPLIHFTTAALIRTFEDLREVTMCSNHSEEVPHLVLPYHVTIYEHVEAKNLGIMCDAWDCFNSRGQWRNMASFVAAGNCWVVQETHGVTEVLRRWEVAGGVNMKYAISGEQGPHSLHTPTV